MSSRIIRASTLLPDQICRVKFKLGKSVAPSIASVLPAEPDGQKLPAQTPGPEDPAGEEQSKLLLQQARTTVSDIAEIRVSEKEEETYEKGFAEGGKARGEADAKTVESLLKQFAASIEEINKLRRSVFSSSEREVIRLALEIATKVIHREVTIDEDLILTLVKVAMNRIAGHALVTVRVNPKDYQSIERHRAEDPAAGPPGETVKLMEDPEIARGGCVIETESGTIDARIEEQLREIEKAFFE